MGIDHLSGWNSTRIGFSIQHFQNSDFLISYFFYLLDLLNDSNSSFSFYWELDMIPPKRYARMIHSCVHCSFIHPASKHKMPPSLANNKPLPSPCSSKGKHCKPHTTARPPRPPQHTPVQGRWVGGCASSGSRPNTSHWPLLGMVGLPLPSLSDPLPALWSSHWLSSSLSPFRWSQLVRSAIWSGTILLCTPSVVLHLLESISNPCAPKKEGTDGRERRRWL